MNLFQRLFVFSAAVLLGASSVDAHVLVFRMRLSGKFTYEDAAGKFDSETHPAHSCQLWFLDLDTACWEESSGKGTSAESIYLTEKSGASGAAAVKHFSHAPDVGEGDAEHRVCHKFTFYSKSRKFYYFYLQTDANAGFDTGTILARGSCKSNVDIGGARTSSVPIDFTAPILRGDGTSLGKGVLSFKYDATLTKAVNEHLKANSIQSASDSGVSTSIPAATTWLIQDYLPNLSYVEVVEP